VVDPRDGSSANVCKAAALGATPPAVDCHVKKKKHQERHRYMEQMTPENADNDAEFTPATPATPAALAAAAGTTLLAALLSPLPSFFSVARRTTPRSPITLVGLVSKC